MSAATSTDRPIDDGKNALRAEAASGGCRRRPDLAADLVELLVAVVVRALLRGRVVVDEEAGEVPLRRGDREHLLRVAVVRRVARARADEVEHERGEERARTSLALVMARSPT